MLLDIEDRLQGLGKELKDYGLPDPSHAARQSIMALDASMTRNALPRVLREEMCYDRGEQTTAGNAHYEVLTNGQRIVTDHVLDCIQRGQPAAIFVHANAGCGKTFMFNTMLEKVRGQGHVALAVAQSGIAATLLRGGRTAHSRFHLPLDPKPTSTCNYSAQSDTAKLIREAKLILWDEGPMAHRYHLETLDRSLRDTMQVDEPFGGKVIVLAGDYRQTLPVIPRANRGQIVGSTHPRSPLWQHFRIFFLRDNMRVINAGGDAVDSQWYMDWLLRVGDGREQRPIDAPIDTPLDFIEIPPRLCLEQASREALIDFVYPDLVQNHVDHKWMAERAILAPHNSTVQDINNSMLDIMPGEEHVLYSADSINPSEMHGELDVPVEYLNTLNGSGLPPHELRLKRGVPIMLLRNLDPPEGLCNGTRLIVEDVINGKVLKATIAGTNRTILLPRIELQPKDGIFPFSWKRRQFPVKLSFAMTINKSQGQTLRCVGIDLLMKPAFTHGQLYVAASRVGDPSNIKFLVPSTAGNCTRNVVYTDALIPNG